MATFIDDDYTDTSFEMYRSGHNRMVQKGCQPSGRLDLPDVLEAPLDDILKEWELDPQEFRGRAREARLALQRQKRRLGKLRGFRHHDTMTDSQLTDYYHHTLWPNVTLDDEFGRVPDAPDRAASDRSRALHLRTLVRHAAGRWARSGD